MMTYLPKVSAGIAIAVLGSTLLSSVSFAGPMFDPDGQASANTAKEIATLDLLPGNSVAVNGITSPTSFTQLYQARLGAILDDAGNVIPVPGLNQAGGFEITAVVGFKATGTQAGSSFNSALQTSTGSFLRLYYDAAMNANDLAGTGFADGTRIFEAPLRTSQATFLNFGTTHRFDAFGNDDFGNLTADGIGGLSLQTFNPTYWDANFFVNGYMIAALLANTSDATPFNQVNPSRQFVNLDGSAYTPNLGATNGVNGPDVQLQADANASFLMVPEPASLGLLGLGALGLIARRRR